MAHSQELIDKLIEKLELLFKKQAEFSSEINSLKEELYRLQSGVITEAPKTIEEAPLAEPLPIDENDVKIVPKTEIASLIREEIAPVIDTQPISQNKIIEHKEEAKVLDKKPKSKSSLEKFIGENLLNKIGILITIIGVVIGAKYSIENNLISPTTRIVIGYLMAIGLLGFGIKLKEKYESYSAVLVSGAIVILYVLTYFAYDFYGLIPQVPAFVLMVVFTTFTVVAAINYNRQVIAHIGLVGAYAVPFLLSSGSGQVEVLFGYMAIINIGILILSFKKYWKPLYYSAFIFTWLIYGSWYFFEYDEVDHFYLALGFLSLFFLIFYVTFLAYKMLRKEVFKTSDVVLLLLNSFLFYGFGIAILEDNETGSQLLGLFTLGNAVIHFIVSVIFYKKKLGDKNLFYLASAMVLVFITITIPVQLNGNWVTLLWVTEAALLFGLGRTKAIKVYEKLSYPLMVLAFISLLEDWSYGYSVYYGIDEENILPLIFNVYFLTSLLFIAAFGAIVWFSKKEAYVSALKPDSIWNRVFSYGIPAILLFSAYYAFRLEIETYWDQLYYTSQLSIPDETTYNNVINNYDLNDFKIIWVLNYSLLFMSLLALINFKIIKSKPLDKIALGLIVVSVFTFLTQGLLTLSELRESYLNPSEYFAQGEFYLWIRYVCFAFLAFALYTCYRFIKQAEVNKGFKIAYDILLHVSIIWVLSSELIHWMDMSDSTQSYKLGLSILWGVYSFLLIAFGIWKNKAYLRIGGIAFFGITLVKLFFYDISHLNTISKTIVFVSLGVLLLIISFLYNKYKNHITDDVKN